MRRYIKLKLRIFGVISIIGIATFYLKIYSGLLDANKTIDNSGLSDFKTSLTEAEYNGYIYIHLYCFLK